MDADDVLLCDGGDVRELLLHIAQGRVRDMAVPVGDDDEHGRDRERDHRQLPLEEEQDCRDRQDREDVLEEEDESVPEEEADALQVDRGARHQLAGLVAVVEPERQADEMGIEALAQIHLDRERLLTGDQPARGHQERAGKAQADDRPDKNPELARVVRRDRLVDDVLRDPDERDLRALRGYGEDDRDDERDLVRTQEAEQTRKRPAIRRGRSIHHPFNLAPAVVPTGARVRPGRVRLPASSARDWRARSATRSRLRGGEGGRRSHRRAHGYGRCNRRGRGFPATP